MSTSRTQALFALLLLFLILIVAALTSSLAMAEGHRVDDPQLTPSPTPVGESPSQPSGPEIQQFSTSQASPTDRGIDPTSLIVNLFDQSDHREPVRTLRWTDPIQFFFDCFGESFPYEGCKLVPDLTEGGNWSLKWEGDLLVPEDGAYTFDLPGHDDGVRVIIDGTEIVDSGWRFPDPNVNPPPRTVPLAAGTHSIAIDYEQRVPFIAEIDVRWDGPGFEEESLPIADIGEARIEAVEFTQAIQESQTLSALKADLEDNGQPPVPIVELKPAVARVYFSEVDATTFVQVRFRISGVVSRTEVRLLQPGCTVEEQRLGDGGCASVDFYFGPPEGNWEAILETFDNNSEMLESHEFPVASRSVRPIRMVPVTVCDADGCEDGRNLHRLLPLLRTTAPTNRVEMNQEGRDRFIYVQSDVPGTVPPFDRDWWIRVFLRLNSLWATDLFPDLFYQGLVREQAPEPGFLGWGGGRGAATRVGALSPSADAERYDRTIRTVTHETGHMLDQAHTDVVSQEEIDKRLCSRATDNPSQPSGWEHDNNSIQEVGFDVSGFAVLDPDNPTSRLRILDPDTTFEIMGYCDPPQWVSPHTYTGEMDYLTGPYEPPVPGIGQPGSTAQGSFWHLSGIISGEGVEIDPIFVVPTTGPIIEGDGGYRIESVDGAGNVLSARRFDPQATSPSRLQGEGHALVFSQLLPFNPEATEILITDPDGGLISELLLDGSAPTVEILSPTAGQSLSGEVVVSWSALDPDSNDLSYQVHYTPDDWQSVHVLAMNTEETSLSVDFDRLSGCSIDCQLRVLASDGVNTGSDTTGDFVVNRKPPEVEIVGPPEGMILQLNQLAWLQATALDPEDGYLRAATTIWTSDIDGILGTGDDLPTTDLSEGSHTITFSATDSDGNTASDQVHVHVDGTPPVLDLHVLRDAIPSSCVRATIGATEEAGGSGLRTVEYSLDGGEVWHHLDHSTLPSEFYIPGTGDVHLVARAIDIAGNISVSDVPFSISEPCDQLNRPPSADAGGPYSSGEGETITLDASQSSDPDNNIEEYRWDLDNDGDFDDAVGSTSDIVFGDDGVFTVRLTILDEFGESDLDTAQITVANLAPEVHLDRSDVIQPASNPTLLGRVNTAQVHSASASDEGSDDLTFSWSDGSETTYFNNGSDPDPGSSPAGVFPFAAQDSAEVTFEFPGVHEVSVTVTDDDGSSSTDSLPKLVTGSESCTMGLGFWRHRFSDRGRQHIDDDTLSAYLAIVNHTSMYFSEFTPFATLDDAGDVLWFQAPDMRARAEAHMATAWLNFGAGAVDWDQTIETDSEILGNAPFHEVMSTAEGILLHPAASREDLEAAKDMAELISEAGGEGDECRADN